MAPVLNLSGSQDFDQLHVTDVIASEFQAVGNMTVIPVNLALAELVRSGRTTVETPEDAVALAQTFSADATIVTAITEYDPYDPPRVGMVMQWYEARPQRSSGGFRPVQASRASRSGEAQLSEYEQPAGPRWQVQRVFDAADERVLDQIRDFAEKRDGHNSPFGYRKYVKSQELYVHYCGAALIKTITKLDEDSRAVVGPHEAKR